MWVEKLSGFRNFMRLQELGMVKSRRLRAAKQENRERFEHAKQDNDRLTRQLQQVVKERDG